MVNFIKHQNRAITGELIYMMIYIYNMMTPAIIIYYRCIAKDNNNNKEWHNNIVNDISHLANISVQLINLDKEGLYVLRIDAVCQS